MPDQTYDSFVKALRGALYDDDASKMVSEFKNLTEKDKVDLSHWLNAEGFTHPQYEPKV